MTPDIGELPVADEEGLARFILRSVHVRSDGSVKPDPFMPYRWVELSVTRHRGLADAEIWSLGQGVAHATGTTLHGRADIEAVVFVRQHLRVLPRPLPDNPNHADVVDWPADKAAQKELALLIARDATFTPKPPM